MTGLFSSSVSYQAKLPLHFSLCNFPPSTGKTCTFSVCMWRIHLEGIGVIKVAEYIFLYLHSHVFLGHDDQVFFYSAFAFIMPKAYRSPLKSMQSRLSALCLRNSSFIRGSPILHTNLGAGGSPYH